MKQLYKRVLVSNNDTFYFPAGEKLANDELQKLINYNAQTIRPKYKENMKMYLGKHDILDRPNKPTGETNRIVVNLPKYITDTFTGYFLGIPPRINLENDTDNELLQNWLKQVSFADKLNKICKFTDIYGRAYGFIYQDEDSNTCFATTSPTKSFMVYDDTVEHKPLAFVRYQYLKNQSSYQACGTIYYADAFYDFQNAKITDSGRVNPYKVVPAAEFEENDTKTGIFDSVKTLVNALDYAVSQKADQVAYFDNAYLALIGAKLKEDKNGNPVINLQKNRFLYLPNVNPGSNPKLEFVSKPDADNIQENLIKHLTDWIFQIAMVPNMNDQSFAGNLSGVALHYKILPMKNLAATKERKFTEALRQLFKAVFSVPTVLPESSQSDYDNLGFTFTRNIPEDIATAISNAKNAEGIVSKQTQLKLLPFITDVTAEEQQIQKEQDDELAQTQKAADNLPDYLKPDDHDDDEQ